MIYNYIKSSVKSVIYTLRMENEKFLFSTPIKELMIITK